MKLTHISIRNIRSIEALDYKVPPEAATIYVMGPNETGKSTFLDSLTFALAGTRGIPDDVVRRGAKAGKVDLAFDDGTKVERRISGRTSSLRLILPDGAEAKSPQSQLDAMLGPCAMDLWALAEREPVELRRELLEAAGKAQPMRELDAAEAAATEDRKLIGREVKRLEGALATVAKPGTYTPAAEPDLAPLRAQIREARAQHEARTDASHGLDLLRRQADQIRDHVLSLEAQLDKARAELDAIMLRGRTAKAALDAMPCPDLPALEAELAAAEAEHTLWAHSRDWRTASDGLAKAKSEYDALDSKIEKLREQRTALLGGLDIGVAGVTVDEETIRIDGATWPNVATSKRLRFAFALKTRTNPVLKLVRIRDGNVLDAASRAFVDELAREHGYLVMIERVTDSGPAALVLTHDLDGDGGATHGQTT